MTEIAQSSRLDAHLRLRLGDLSPEQFERFFLLFFNAGISITIERDGRSVERRVIEANTYAAGSGRAQQGIDLIAKMEGGETWVFQCKRVKKWAPSDTGEAIEKASGFPANHYFLLLACNPSQGVEEVIAQHPKWSLWNLDRICTEFRLRVPESQHPKVLYFLDPVELKRFAPYASDALISPQKYWESVTQSEESFFHKFRLVGREAQIAKLNAFAASGASKVMIVSGNGGEGKSRLVYEFAREFLEQHSDTKIIFLNPHSTGDLQTSLWSLLEPRIVVVDDAHRIERVSDDLLNTVRESENTKLILVTRPQGNEILEEKLRTHGLLGTHKQLSLTPLKKKEIKQLAEEVLGTELSSYAPHLIARTGDSPFLTTLAGDLIRRKKIEMQQWASDREFYQTVLRSFKEGNLEQFAPEDKEQADQLLRVIALLSPVIPNAEFASSAGECLGVSAVRVETLFHRLQSVGVINAESKNIRVIPDLFSDYLVFDTAFDPKYRLPVLAERILKFFSKESAVLIRNLAEAAWLAQSEAINRDELLRPLLEAEFTRFDNLSFYERGKMLEEWSAFSVFLPKEALELSLRAIGQKAAPSPYSPWGSAAQSIDSYNFTSSKIPTLLKPVALYLDDYRHEALDVIWPLGLPIKRKNDARGHPWEVVAEVIKFELTKPIEVSVSALDWVAKLVRRESTREILESSGAMLSILLSPCFAREVDGTEWQGRTMTWWTRPVDIQRTSVIRDQALEILRWVVRNRSWRAAVSVVGTLGYALARAAGFRVQIANVQKYVESWRPERLKALGLIDEILQLHKKAPVRFAIRQWLLQDQPYEEDPIFKKKARQILSSIIEDLDLQIAIATLTQSHYEFYEDLGKPSGSEFHEQSHQLWFKKLEEIARALILVYPEPAACITFLDQATTDLGDCGYNPRFYHLFPAIGRVNPSYGAALVRILLHTKERNLIAASWFELLGGLDSQSLIEELLALGKASAHAWLRKGVIMYLLFKNPLSASEKQIMDDLALEADNEEIYQFLQLIQRLSDEDAAWGLELLKKLKLEGVADEQQKELLQDLYPYRSRSIKPSLATVEHVLNALVAVKMIDIDHSSREFNELAKDYPESLYHFIVKRLQYAETLKDNEYSYRPLFNPNRGSIDLSALRNSDQYPSICEFLWSKVVSSKSVVTRFSWIELFQMVVMENTSFWLPRLLAKIDRASHWDELRSLVDLVKFDGSLIIFRFPEVAAAFLKAAENIDGITGVKRMQYSLYSASGPQGRSFTNGNLDPGYDYLEANALKAAEDYPEDPHLGPFYRWIVQVERDERERSKRDYELSLKAYDE